MSCLPIDYEPYFGEDNIWLWLIDLCWLNYFYVLCSLETQTTNNWASVEVLWQLARMNHTRMFAFIPKQIIKKALIIVFSIHNTESLEQLFNIKWKCSKITTYQKKAFAVSLLQIRISTFITYYLLKH